MNRNRAILFLWWTALSVALGSDLKRDERVIFFPTLGQRIEGGTGWRLDIHGCVYEPESRRALSAVFRRSLGIDEDELTKAEKATFKERMDLFLVDHERSKKVSVRLGESVHTLGTSGANGHFQTTLALGNDELSRLASLNPSRPAIVRFQFAGGARHTKAAQGEILLLAESGLSVISDIDDTIKISQVRDRKEMLRNTFVRPFQPVPGLAAVYQSWAESGASFHYVSASPWQLYQPLSEFTRRHGFPTGTWHMKMFRVKDQSAFALFASPEQYKPEVIGSLFQRFPQRRFVLVGDSGEKDPEIYGDLARRHRQQVARILIRDVTGEPPESPRYTSAFRDLPPALWQIFKDSTEIAHGLPPQSKTW